MDIDVDMNMVVLMDVVIVAVLAYLLYSLLQEQHFRTAPPFSFSSITQSVELY